VSATGHCDLARESVGADLLQSAVGMPRCLIIDDDRDSREGYAEYLQVFGFDVQVLPDARDALRQIVANHPDVVILDLRMPFVDGWEFVRRLRRRLPRCNVPVIAVSACAFPEDQARAQECGCNAFLAKPATPDRVLAAIREQLRLRRKT
jgi:two-component system, cell cycle response regulator DivK